LAILLRQNIELTNVPVGTCRVLFDRVDFGNFLVHPLMTAAAATAVQVGWGRSSYAAPGVKQQAESEQGSRPAAGQHWRTHHQLICLRTHEQTSCLLLQGKPFVFEAPSVRISPPSPTAAGGALEFTGTWRGDGQRYQVRLLPVAQGAAMGRGVQAHAVPLSIGGRASECWRRLLVRDVLRLTNPTPGMLTRQQRCE
jgi:hypothetical protein